MPGQSSASQQQYVILNGSMSQSSLPLSEGVQYSLSWYDSCEQISQDGGAGSPCSYSVTTTNPSQTLEFSYGAGQGVTWQQQSLLTNYTIVQYVPSVSPPATTVSFTQLSGHTTHRLSRVHLHLSQLRSSHRPTALS